MRTEKSKIKHLPALQRIKIPIQLDLWGYEAIWVQEAIYGNRLVGIYMRMVQISVRDGLKGVR
jgi:hypothetical protein